MIAEVIGYVRPVRMRHARNCDAQGKLSIRSTPVGRATMEWTETEIAWELNTASDKQGRLRYRALGTCLRVVFKGVHVATLDTVETFSIFVLCLVSVQSRILNTIPDDKASRMSSKVFDAHES